ncbi:uncharacterized protein A1O9_07148 [Exophiala aquamarina CBS 119918]|uniref:Transcription factor domain-containing protein n=1 Tax=Exophiala aquamarina CBS 119918 TaxID=1182545 RepID=A0A072PCD8_9EURO|nr:uncharacterized protein A1O9_07148 [Exophiala aquamarina CBS 119918]KEF56958.1 hypothetical protein A1O9_07148 [Exophiala aquamarina CBS 119918]
MVKTLMRQNAYKEATRTPSSPVAGLAYEDVQFSEAATAASTSLDLNAAPLPNKGPILSLFHNDIMTQSASGNNVPVSTLKGENTCCHLRRLLPASEEVDAILVASTDLWSDWFSHFPELWCETKVDDLRADFWRRIASSQPVEVAKMLIFLLITIDNVPIQSLNSRSNTREQRNSIIAEIERLVVQDIEFARTVPGTECMALLAKYLVKLGHLLSAWHLIRRTIEYAILFGMHMPRCNALAGSRRDNLALWTSLCHYDAYVSLILGFPYCALSAHVARQPNVTLDGKTDYAHIFFLGVTTIMRQIITRNQTDSNDLLETLKIDQELDRLAAQSPAGWWHLDLDPAHSNKTAGSRFIIQMQHHFIRALLYLPFVLEEPLNPKQRFCYDTAVESARSLVNSYRILRGSVGLIPYLGILADFQVFTMAILLIVHNTRRENKCGPDRRRGDLKDWDLITEVANILHSIARASEENVAMQGSTMLSKLLEVRKETGSDGGLLGQGRSCKITIPCFGTITISLGKELHHELPGHLSDGPAQAEGLAIQESNEYESGQQAQGLLTEIENLITIPSVGFSGDFEEVLPNSIFEYEPRFDLDSGWDLNFFD